MQRCFSDFILRPEDQWNGCVTGLLALLWVYGSIGEIPVHRPFLYFALLKLFIRSIKCLLWCKWLMLVCVLVWTDDLSIMYNCFFPYECWDWLQDPLWVWLGITCGSRTADNRKRKDGFHLYTHGCSDVLCAL